MSTLLRTIKQGFFNFIRNGWLSLASITIMVLTLLTIAIFLILNMVISAGINEIQDKMDISVYFNDTAKEKDILSLQQSLSKMPEVKAIDYVSKQEALAKMKQTFSDNEKILSPLGNDNPLPASLGIKVYKVEDFDTIAKIFEKKEIKPLIHNVSYKKNETIIKRLYVATNFIKKAGFSIAAMFTVTSLIIIFNTVRMAIYARQEEVEIMQLVGANYWFIKGPFIIEGMIIGLIATIISQIIILPTLSYLVPVIDKYLGGGVSGNISSYLGSHLFQVIGIQLLIGILIGVTSSYFAIRKYLKTV
ncbi:MAG: permease-like cell division protein FtsX [Patescibacteria group bacterium]|nr:permease-like cell division protein FtsX [Patescibacteria group bacterium]